MAGLTRAASSKSKRTKSGTPSSPTSSRASRDGRSPSGSRGGRATGRSGPRRSPASRSRRRVSAAPKRTSAISGPSFSTSSASAALASSLESRCQRLLDSAGSTEYSLTWKRKATPAGRSFCQLVASALRTSEQGSTGSPSASAGWPTPAAHEFEGGSAEKALLRREKLKKKGYNGNGFGMTLGMLATQMALAGWSTPDAFAGERRARPPQDLKMTRENGAKRQLTINDAAARAGWPTAMANDAIRGGRVAPSDKTLNNAAAMTAGWNTPRATDGTNGGPSQANGALSADAAKAVAGWPTPTVLDRPRSPETLAKCAAFRKRNANQNTVPMYLGEVAATAAWASPKASNGHGAGTRGDGGVDLQTMALSSTPGRIPSSFPARTGSGGVLAPEFSLWLMGFPAAWQRSAPNWGDWRRWQDLMAGASSVPKAIASASSRAAATPSSPLWPPSLFAPIWTFFRTALR
jgi:hypothetical protein